MPYMTSPDNKACSKCLETGKLFRQRTYKKTQMTYLYAQCRDCEFALTKKHQKENKEYWNRMNAISYQKVSAPRVSRRNVLDRDDNEKAQRARDKSNARCTRAKQARVDWDKELTEFVYKEAHDLRKRRNKLTGFEWHVDHVVPLKGKFVCGLHVWNNFRVIPKVINLRKGNNHSIPNKW